MEWLIRMKQALDVMEEQIEEPLNVAAFAKAAYTSPFHFQRMFYMLTGFTVAEYVRRRKLTLAAQELAMSDARVLDVALKYGYESPESFAKAFRKAHGLAPSAAREPGARLKAFPRLTFHLSLKGDQDMDYHITNRESFQTVGKAIRTTCVDGENHRRIPQFWEEVNTDGTARRLEELAPDKAILGICADHDQTQETLTYEIAVEYEGEVPEGLVSRTVPAATWAVFTSVGPMPHAIQNVWHRIFQEWFPSTGYEHSGGPEFEVYPEGDPNAADYRCEIWIPVVRK